MIRFIEEWKIQSLYIPNIDKYYYFRSVFKLFNNNFLAEQGLFGFFGFAFIFSAISTFLTRNKKLLTYSLFVIIIFFILNFGFLNLLGRPITKWVRFLNMLVPMLIIVISGSTYQSIKNLPKKIYLDFIVVGISIISIIILPNYLGNTFQTIETKTYDFKAIAEELKVLPRKTVYSDMSSFQYLKIYLGGDYEVLPLENVNSIAQITDAYVIIDSTDVVILNEDAISDLPEFIRDREFNENWKLYKEIIGPNIGNYSLYNPKIYIVDENKKCQKS